MVVTIVMVWDFAERFKILGKMIASISELKESGTQFVFVPAMSDVGASQSIPPTSTILSYCNLFKAGKER